MHWKLRCLWIVMLLSAVAIAQSKHLHGSGCIDSGVEKGCLIVKDKTSGKTFSLHFPTAANSASVGQAITFWGEERVDSCQQGTAVNVTKFTILKMLCPSGDGSASTEAGKNPKLITVYKPDGTLQCGQGHEISLATMEKELAGAGIKVHSRAKDTDGMMHTQVCGAATGAVNAYQIEIADKVKATKLGFHMKAVAP